MLQLFDFVRFRIDWTELSIDEKTLLRAFRSNEIEPSVEKSKNQIFMSEIRAKRIPGHTASRLEVSSPVWEDS